MSPLSAVLLVLLVLSWMGFSAYLGYASLWTNFVHVAFDVTLAILGIILAEIHKLQTKKS